MSTSDERSPAGEALTQLLVEVVRLAERFTQTGEALARPDGQTLARWLVLETLASGPEPVAAIARRLRLTRQSVQRVANALERDGLVTYEPNPRHRRAKLASLTTSGAAVLQRIQARQREWADRSGTDFSVRELREAADALRHIRDTLGSSP